MVEAIPIEEVKKEPAKPRDYNILLGTVLHKLLKAAPQNPAVRAHIMALVRKPVPDEADTYDAVIAWIDTQMPNAGYNCRMPRQGNYPFYVHHTRNESGRCTFEATCTASHRVTLTVGDIMQIAEDTLASGGSLDTFNEKLLHWLEDTSEEYVDAAGDDWFDEHKNQSSCDHNDYDTEDQGDITVSVPGRVEVVRNVQNVLNQACPELLVALRQRR